MVNMRVTEIEVTSLQLSKGVRFLKGPIPWPELCAAARIPGKALAVFAAIHHRVALTRNATVTLPKLLLLELGVSRDAKARALRDLERQSLIYVDRQKGRSARIRLSANQFE